jgi:hypothetical protein
MPADLNPDLVRTARRGPQVPRGAPIPVHGVRHRLVRPLSHPRALGNRFAYLHLSPGELGTCPD